MQHAVEPMAAPRPPNAAHLALLFIAVCCVPNGSNNRYLKPHSCYEVNMRIGELAQAVGCHIETVRYYEKVGLIPVSARKPNGYRDYSDKHLQYLRLVRRAKSLGFAQSEVQELVNLIENKDNSCEQVFSIVTQQIKVLDEKLKEIRRLKKALTDLSSACKEDKLSDCPALEELLQGH